MSQFTMQDDRKKILGRIRKALSVPAPRGHTSPAAEHTPEPAFESQLPIIGQGSYQQWLPPVGASWDEQAELFARNSTELITEFLLCEDEAQLHAHLNRLKDEHGWNRVASHQGELNDAATAALGLPCLLTDDGYDVTELEKCDAGITQCEALIAQTGSVLVTNRSAGGRALSVLPPHHVVLARRAQLLPDLTAAFTHLQAKYGDDFPTMMSFITGPSRTGDIERILVLGAHGPKRLTILCY